jgi:hypothetical protein
VYKSIHINSKLIVKNNIDYYGHECFLEKSPMSGSSMPFQRTVRDTSMHLGEELRWKPHFYYELSEGEKSIICDQARTVRPLGADHLHIENQKTLKVPGSVKFILTSSRTVWDAWPDYPQILYLTSNDTFNALIAITADRCNSSCWCAGVDHPGQERGPSTCGKKLATIRKCWCL